MTGVRQLNVFRRAYDAGLRLHQLTGKRRPDGVIDQMRRSSKAVAANLAEAYNISNSAGERRRLLGIAMREADETKVWLEYCRDLGYLSEADVQQWFQEYDEIGAMLYALWRRQGDRIKRSPDGS